MPAEVANTDSHVFLAQPAQPGWHKKQLFAVNSTMLTTSPVTMVNTSMNQYKHASNDIRGLCLVPAVGGFLALNTGSFNAALLHAVPTTGKRAARLAVSRAASDGSAGNARAAETALVTTHCVVRLTAQHAQENKPNTVPIYSPQPSAPSLPLHLWSHQRSPSQRSQQTHHHRWPGRVGEWGGGCGRSAAV